jgi:hypothetical protein
LGYDIEIGNSIRPNFFHRSSQLIHKGLVYSDSTIFADLDDPFSYNQE